MLQSLVQMFVFHQQVNKINKFDEERKFEWNIKASLTSLDPKIVCIQEDQFNKEVHGVTNMRNKGNKYYIEASFQFFIGL